MVQTFLSALRAAAVAALHPAEEQVSATWGSATLHRCIQWCEVLQVPPQHPHNEKMCHDLPDRQVTYVHLVC